MLMKKRLYSLVTLVAMLLLGVTVSMAQSTEEIENYSFGFDSESSIGEVDGSSLSSYFVHDFAPAGWDHLIDYYQNNSSYGSNTTYVNYRFRSGLGTGGGCLQSSSQVTWDYDIFDYRNLYDLLITPLVSGTVQVVASSASSYSYDSTPEVTFYKMTKRNGTWVRGDEIAPTSAVELSYGEWSTYTLAVDEPTYIGLRISDALVDNFSAGHAVIEKNPKLAITSVVDKNGEYNDADAEGHVSLKYDIVLTNNGLVAFNPGDENYSLALTRGEDGEVIGTYNIDKPLAVGATDTIHASYDLSADTLGTESFPAWVKENITGTQHYASTVKVVPYAPVLTVTVSGGTKKTGDSFSFGTSQEAITHKLVLTNDGASPLSITSVSVPAPFTGSLSHGRATSTIQPHKSDTIIVTLPNTTPGTYGGNLVVATNVGDFNLAVSGTIVDADAWFVDFENMDYANQHVLPVTLTAEVRADQPFSDWSISNYPQSLELEGNRLALMNNNESVFTKVISPKLVIGAGEGLTFDAAQRGTSSTLEVYYSADRKNWTRAYTIVSDSTATADNWFDQNGDGGYSKYYYFHNYQVNTIPAGEYYVAFSAGNVVIDNILGYKVADVAHDIYFSTQPKAQGTAMVNYGVTDKVTIHNSNLKAESGDGYTLRYYAGDELVAQYDGKDLAAGADAEYAVSYTPHKAGRWPVYAKVVFADGTEFASDSDTIDVVPEVASNDVQVGTPSSTGASTSAPANLYYHYSKSVSLYPSELIGLASGTQIKGITFKGYCEKDITFATQLWIGNSDLAALPTSVTALSDVVDTTSLTKVYDADYNFTPTGESSGWGVGRTISTAGNVLTIPLAEPFTYTGGNLVIAAVTSNPSAYATAVFEADTDYPSNAVIQSYDDENYASGWTSTNLPVVYFDVDAKTPELSGTVKDAQGEPVANAPVVLHAGGVQYAGTTDAQGAYTIPVIQKTLKYTLTVSVAGYAPYSVEGVSVAADATRDIVLEPATGLFIQGHDIPATGQVNSKYTATATVLNDIVTTIGAADYTARLFVNGEPVSTAETVDIESMKSAKLTFGFTPHEAGRQPAYIQFAYGDNVYTTSVDTITIAEENFGGLIQVGDSTAMVGGTGATPWNNWYKYSQSELIYTAADLGLDNGAVIKNVAFRGRFMGSSTGKEALRVYIENTSDEPATVYENYRGYVLHDTTSMTKILDDSVAYGDTPTRYVHDVLSVPVPAGFVYTGHNIRITVLGDHVGQDDNQIEWVVDESKSGRGVNRRTDSGVIDEENWALVQSAPVLYLTVDAKKTVSGTVTAHADGSAIAGASVLLRSGDVEYSGTTDAEGNFSIDVAKGALTYELVATAPGYQADTTSNIVFGVGATVEAHATLYKVVSVSGVVYGTTVQAFAHVSQPLAGATVTLKDASGQAIATTTTDAEGNYSVDGLLEGNDYTLEFSAEGYISDTLAIAAGGADIALSDTLKTQEVLGIEGVGASAGKAATGDVYTIGGQFVGRNVDKATLRRGIYIINGKKVVVK